VGGQKFQRFEREVFIYPALVYLDRVVLGEVRKMRTGSGIVSIILVVLLVFTLFAPLTALASGNNHRAKYLDARVESVLDDLIAYLDAIKAKIEVLEENGARPRVSSSDLQDDIDELEAFKIELEGCETREEVLELVKRIRSSWIGISEDVRYSTNFISYYQIGRNIDQMETFSEGMNARLDELEDTGKDVSKLRTHLSEFDRHLESAQDEYNRGLSLSEEGKLRDANNHFRNAQRHLISANRILKPLVRVYMGMV